MAPPKGFKFSKETRDLWSQQRKGKKFTDAHRENLSKALKGRPSPTKGMKFGPETFRKRSIANSGENNPMFGKEITDEHRAKLSLKSKGKPKSEEMRKKLSQTLTGRKHSVITIERMRETILGGYWYGNVRYYDGPQYCEKFNKNLKERVRAFFGYCCLECGTPQNGQSLHVHHVWYNKKACCDDTPRSLVPLCIGCHTETTFGDRDEWSQHFQDMIDLYYDGKCWLTKEEYAELFPKTKPSLSPSVYSNTEICSSDSRPDPHLFSESTHESTVSISSALLS